jgi:hypothetical protein
LIQNFGRFPRGSLKETDMKYLVLSLACLCFGLSVTPAVAPAPVGLTLPSVTGHALSREQVTFPDDLAGRPAVLLVAYRRGTQADVYRWTAFLEAKAPRTARYEVPAIANIIWRPMAGWIDSGMRGGVPKAAWSSVVTLYDDASKLRDFLGDYGGYTTHVVLLDKAGKVAWFNAGGFNDRAASSLLEAVHALDPEPSP